MLFPVKLVCCLVVYVVCGTDAINLLAFTLQKLLETISESLDFAKHCWGRGNAPIPPLTSACYRCTFWPCIFVISPWEYEYSVLLYNRNSLAVYTISMHYNCLPRQLHTIMLVRFFSLSYKSVTSDYNCSYADPISTWIVHIYLHAWRWGGTVCSCPKYMKTCMKFMLKWHQVTQVGLLWCVDTDLLCCHNIIIIILFPARAVRCNFQAAASGKYHFLLYFSLPLGSSAKVMRFTTSHQMKDTPVTLQVSHATLWTIMPINFWVDRHVFSTWQTHLEWQSYTFPLWDWWLDIDWQEFLVSTSSAIPFEPPIVRLIPEPT